MSRQRYDGIDYNPEMESIDLNFDVEAETLPEGEPASAERRVDKDNIVHIKFGIPKGEKGNTGADGEIGPQGIPGDKGETGDSGVYVGTEEPTDPKVKVWIDTEGEEDGFLMNIEKDEENKEVVITDSAGKETKFPYGGSSKKNSYTSLTKIRDYVHQAVYTDIDYQAAYSFFEKMRPASNVMADDYKPTPTFEKPIGACSAFFFAGMLARMYDWNFNEQETIEVKTPAFGERYAVTGTGYNANLTKEVVESGEYREYFDYLPFELVDGVNEHGFAIAMLVVPNDYGITTGTTPEEVEDEVSMLMLPRYLLDRAIDINDAMYYLERKVSVYNVMPLIQMGYEIHYFVADESGNHGVIEFIDNTPIFTQTEIATNFYIHGVQFNDDGTVYTPATQDADHDAMRTNFITEFGSGLERYNLINDTLKNAKSEEDIIMLLMNLMYTNAYKRTTDPFWYTEFVGGKYNVATSVETYEQPDGIIEKAIAEFGKRDRATGTTWQTVHGGLIDCERKRMYLAFQEDLTEIYSFGFNYYTAQQVDSIIGEIGWGNLKYNQYQNLSNQDFNQVMQNLKLNARIDEYFDSEAILDEQSLDIAAENMAYTLAKTSIRAFSGHKEYEILLSFSGYGTISIHGRYKTDSLIVLEGESMGVQFERLENNGNDIVISFKTDLPEVPNLTGIRVNELTMHRTVTPIVSELIPHDDTKVDKENTGWIEAGANGIQYRRTNGVVEIVGHDFTIPLSESTVELFVLPDGFRPDVETNFYYTTDYGVTAKLGWIGVTGEVMVHHEESEITARTRLHAYFSLNEIEVYYE